MIEVEIRSLISREKYEELIAFFKKNSKYLNEDYQETYYFDSPQDLRIQKNNFYSKVWLKKGSMHDSCREEVEIRLEKKDFDSLNELFLSLGFNVSIKWFRTRHSFLWDNLNVTVDYTKGYGYIVELEKMTLDDDKESALRLLNERMKLLNIAVTPKEEFDKKFKDYKDNWKTLTK